jgi:hypothetical protein
MKALEILRTTAFREQENVSDIFAHLLAIRGVHLG